MGRFLKLALSIGIALGFSATADAGFWFEVGDAFDLPSTSQITLGTGSLDSISGTISDGVDRDMFLIFITGPSVFSATTVGGPALFDTQLFLFDRFGFGILANDDDPGGGTVFSNIPTAFTGALTPGLYNLAISKRNTSVAESSDPVSAGGLIFPDEPRTGVYGPTGPGGGSPITSWFDGNPGDPSYTISLTGAEFANPEPSAIALASFGALTLMGYFARWRRSRFKNGC